MSIDTDRAVALLQASSVAAARLIAILDQIPAAYGAGEESQDLQEVLLDAAKEAANVAFSAMSQHLPDELGIETTLDSASYRNYLRELSGLSVRELRE